MLVADTSALVSIATADLVAVVVEEFDVHTTERVAGELRETAGFDDRHGEAAAEFLDRLDDLTVHSTATPVESARVDPGEGSCAVLADELEAEFLLTDDLRALPELQVATGAEVVISPILLRALVERDVLTTEGARDNLGTIAEGRDWLGAPIYRRARGLFEH
jgi:predicted nucleic acid-binding protein